MNRIVILFALVLFLLPFSAAEQESNQDFYFKQFEPADIKIVCEDDVFSGPCGSSTSANITIYDPDGKILVSNVKMSRTLDVFNYTLGKTERTGTYTAVSRFQDGALADVVTSNFYITTNGKPDVVFPIELTILLSSIILIAVGSIFRKLRLFKQVGSMILLVMGIITLYPGYGGFNHTTLIGQLIGFMSIGSGLYFLVNDLYFLTSEKGKDLEYIEEEEI